MKKIIMIISLILVILISACGSSGSQKDDEKTDSTADTKSDLEQTEENKEDISNDDKEKIEDADKVKAPDFTLSDGKGNTYTLSDYKGRIVFVNFWTTWCIYCVEEMPDFQNMYDKYKNEDIVILAINVQTDSREKPEKEVLDWVKENGYTFPVLFDDIGVAENDYVIRGYPTTFIVDREGYVLGYVHAMDEALMEQIIDSVK